jgi:RNA polymerase sigma-70 factor (ECF subfamily)
MPIPRRLDPDRVVAYLPRLYHAARAWTSSREDAEDLVQETCARVLARPRLLYGEDELGYLMRALRNALVSQRRAAARRPRSVELGDDGQLQRLGADVARSRDGDPVEGAVRAEVLVAIAELPDEFRDALVAVDVAGLSYREAARVLGLPEGTVTSRLFRARDRVAARLGAQDWTS